MFDQIEAKMVDLKKVVHNINITLQQQINNQKTYTDETLFAFEQRVI